MAFHDKVTYGSLEFVFVPSNEFPRAMLRTNRWQEHTLLPTTCRVPVGSDNTSQTCCSTIPIPTALSVFVPNTGLVHLRDIMVGPALDTGEETRGVGHNRNLVDSIQMQMLLIL